MKMTSLFKLSKSSDVLNTRRLRLKKVKSILHVKSTLRFQWVMVFTAPGYLLLLIRIVSSSNPNVCFHCVPEKHRIFFDEVYKKIFQETSSYNDVLVWVKQTSCNLPWNRQTIFDKLVWFPVISIVSELQHVKSSVISTSTCLQTERYYALIIGVIYCKHWTHQTPD